MNFETIYKTHWQKVFRLCMGYVNDTDRAKDLAQETFIKVWHCKGQENLPKLHAISLWSVSKFLNVIYYLHAQMTI